MNDVFTLLLMVIAFTGAIAASYQLFRIKGHVGWAFQSSIGGIILDHITFGAFWLAALLFWALGRRFDIIEGMLNTIYVDLLLVFISIVLWSFVIRTHQWYNKKNK